MAFQGAHSFAIGTFNAMAAKPISTHDPISILHKARAVEATHTSRTASYAPKCHPGTRVKVTGDIVDWAFAGDDVPTGNSYSRPTSICWFQGPAGGGKTCIMRKVAERLAESKRLAGTYFFSNRVPGLSSEGPFAATVAHQLLSTFPEARKAILEAVEENANIFSESVETQMEAVILRPLAELFQGGMRGRKVLVVDGFDECIDPERIHLLRALYTLITSTPSLLLIIASRPEFDIRTTFNRDPYKSITHFLRLEDYDETSGTRSYLCDEFCRIRDTHPARASIPASWPQETTLDVLCQKSSGGYILPSTVIRHVDNPRRNPITLLGKVMVLFEGQDPAASISNPLAPLDDLYSMILHPPEGDIALIKRILHTTRALDEVQRRWGDQSPLFIGGESHQTNALNSGTVVSSPSFLDDLLGLDHGTTDMALCDLHSVIGFAPDGKILFHHATLHDFLSSRTRSKDLFRPEFETLLDLASACARQLESWSRRPSDNLVVHQYSSDAFFRILDLLRGKLQYSERLGSATTEPLPHDLLQFDARLLWKYWIVHNSNDESRAFAVYLLKRMPALISVLRSFYSVSFAGSALGQSLERVRANDRKCMTYWGLRQGYWNVHERNAETVTSLLRGFEAESGLYDVAPTRPAGRTRDMVPAWEGTGQKVM